MLLPRGRVSLWWEVIFIRRSTLRWPINLPTSCFLNLARLENPPSPLGSPHILHADEKNVRVINQYSNARSQRILDESQEMRRYNNNKRYTLVQYLSHEKAKNTKWPKNYKFIKIINNTINFVNYFIEPLVYKFIKKFSMLYIIPCSTFFELFLWTFFFLEKWIPIIRFAVICLERDFWKSRQNEDYWRRWKLRDTAKIRTKRIFLKKNKKKHFFRNDQLKKLIILESFIKIRNFLNIIN